MGPTVYHQFEICVSLAGCPARPCAVLTTWKAAPTTASVPADHLVLQPATSAAATFVHTYKHNGHRYSTGRSPCNRGRAIPETVLTPPQTRCRLEVVILGLFGRPSVAPSWPPSIADSPPFSAGSEPPVSAVHPIRCGTVPVRRRPARDRPRMEAPSARPEAPRWERRPSRGPGSSPRH